jgi:hypothetical protein
VPVIVDFSPEWVAEFFHVREGGMRSRCRSFRAAADEVTAPVYENGVVDVLRSLL